MTNQAKQQGSSADRVLIFDTTLRDGEQSPGASMTLGEVKCVADNVLVQVTKNEEETASGIALAAGVSEQTRTTSGVVVKTGTGRIAADGASVPVPVQVGESVKFKDYAGADIRLDGEDYIVVRVPDCLAKWTE